MEQEKSLKWKIGYCVLVIGILVAVELLAPPLSLSVL
jgi:hypothetical protein